MFNKIVTFRAFEARRIAPEPICAMHSNDNLPGFRRPAGGQRARPKLALACHWCLIGGRLECRWEVETPDGTRSPISTEPEAGRAFGRPVAPPRHDQLLWAAG
jgi:hypothetical protein